VTVDVKDARREEWGQKEGAAERSGGAKERRETEEEAKGGRDDAVPVSSTQMSGRRVEERSGRADGFPALLLLSRRDGANVELKNLSPTKYESI
jgi:hypothetical protein